MIDLHTHSIVSDGSDPPERIPRLAAASGCRAVALTDHDRLDGIEAARSSAAEAAVDLVPGVEVSCAWTGGTMHLLVYFVEPGDGPLQDELTRLQRDRDDRNRRLFQRLAELGLPVSEEEVRAEAGGTGVGRPHVAAVMVKKGLVGSLQEAFDLWLAKGAPAYVAKARLEAGRAVSFANASGGVPVLAHPLTLGTGLAGLGPVVADLAGLGLAGLEAYYGRYSNEERQALAGLAAGFDLVATGGSDYHGSYKPDLQVGTGTGDLHVPDCALDALLARRGA